MARLYFAFWPAPPLREELARLAAALELPGGRRIRAARLHLTLVFLGETDAAGQAQALAAGARVQGPAFELTLDRLGWWPGPRVAWLAPGIAPEPLLTLERDLRAALLEAGLGVDPRPYRPHLTIARDLTAPPRAAPPFAVRWPVDSFALVESRIEAGSRQYLPLEEYPLAPAQAVAPGA
jgi:2'-5' RNA ligase